MAEAEGAVTVEETIHRLEDRITELEKELRETSHAYGRGFAAGIRFERRLIIDERDAEIGGKAQLSAIAMADARSIRDDEKAVEYKRGYDEGRRMRGEE